MIVEGLKLTFLGMLVVFAFLALLVILVRLSSKLLNPLTDKESLVFACRGIKKSRLPTETVNRKLLAVIGAAVFAHRKRTRI